MTVAVCVDKCPKAEGDVVNYMVNDDVLTSPLIAGYETETKGQYCLPTKKVAKEFVKRVLT